MRCKSTIGQQLEPLQPMQGDLVANLPQDRENRHIRRRLYCPEAIRKPR
jgi:hypothetical protein